MDRFGPGDQGNEPCIDKYCIYSTFATGGSATFKLVQGTTFDPGQRPWFRVILDHNNLYRWYAQWSHSGGWNNIQSEEFIDTDFPQVVSGIESSATDTIIGVHRHNENQFSQQSFQGTQNWCYSGIHHFGWSTFAVGGCTSNEWTQSANISP